MTYIEIEKIICEEIGKILAVEKVEPWMFLRGRELGADSLDMIDIQLVLEEKFNIKIDKALNIYDLRTVSDVINEVAKRVRE